MGVSHLPPAWLDAPGQREGRYVIGPLLGHGGMGEVYEAWDTILARPIALKILRHLEPAAMIRFMHEAQLHARLDCPNICRIYDVDACNGAPRIAMQLVRGPTLEDAAEDLRLDEILTILITVATAMHAAHQLKLIHRDIKPSNILLQWAETGGWIPFICDFGLAMALDGPSLTQPLAMTGTPAYMAPEQVRGDRNLICPATDVYGIGSTLYFTLTGRPPCVSTVTAEVLRVKRERRFPAPRSLEPGIPADLETILYKCLQPNPEDRYSSTLELAEELQRFQNGQTIQALPRKILPRIWKRLHYAWPPLIATTAVTALAFSLMIWQKNTQRRQARQVELGQYFALEASHLEQGLSHQRMLPIHDLRPAYAQTRARMEALRARQASMGPEAEPPLHYALGRTDFFIRDFQAARRELDQAWAGGFRTPDTAFLLARLQSQAYLRACEEAAFSDRALPPEAISTLAKAEDLFRQSRGLSSDPQEFADATLAFAQKDYPRAAGLARSSLNDNPWHMESASLGSLSLSAMAAARAEQGDAPQAQDEYAEALDMAQTALLRGPSEERLYHAQATASIGLASLAYSRGDLPMGPLVALQRHLTQVLLLAPEDQEIQSDWLRVHARKVARMMDLGQDPRQALDEGMRFLWTRTREPRSVDLRVDHMQLYFQQALWAWSQGRDPWPALGEALKDAGHAVNRPRDLYGDLLNFKARLEAERGQDPRPTVRLLLQHFQSQAEERDMPCLSEIGAEAWLTQAKWEFRIGLDATNSLHQSQALLQRALETRQHPPLSVRALKTQVQNLVARMRPEK